MLQRTIDDLTAKLPQIQRMLEEGAGRDAICRAMGASHPTLRVFLKQHGIVFDRGTRQTSGITPGHWRQFNQNLEVSPFTHEELHYRDMDEHTPDELDAILARLRTRLPTVAKPRRRARA